MEDSSLIMNSILRDLIKKLLFLSKAKEGQKPCLSGDKPFYQNNSWYLPLFRTFGKESRENLKIHIKKLLLETSIALETYNNSPHFITLIESLKGAKDGLLILKKTYEDDIETTSEITIFIKEIELMLNYSTRE